MYEKFYIVYRHVFVAAFWTLLFVFKALPVLRLTGLPVGRFGVWIPVAESDFLFSITPRPNLGARKTSCSIGSGVFFAEIKRPGRDVDHKPASNAEVKNVRIYISSSLIRLRSLDRHISNSLPPLPLHNTSVIKTSQWFLLSCRPTCENQLCSVSLKITLACLLAVMAEPYSIGDI
jgi:hypothetical protein